MKMKMKITLQFYHYREFNREFKFKLLIMFKMNCLNNSQKFKILRNEIVRRDRMNLQNS